MAEGHARQHHWEYSYYPFIIALGALLAVPLAFSAYFEYGSALGGSVLGLGGLLVLVIGVSGWTSEGLAEPHEHGYAVTGLPIFIISETMIFLSLFTAYWMLRLTAPEWPPPGSPHIGITVPIIMTVILVSSSVTYHFGEMKLEEGDRAGFRQWLMITILLGAVFLAFTAYEYNHLIHDGFTFGTNAKSTAFYSITGFHATHVLLGLGIFLTVLVPALSDRVNVTFATGAGVYWHFVDIVWFFVVSQIYFW